MKVLIATGALALGVVAFAVRPAERPPLSVSSAERNRPESPAAPSEVYPEAKRESPAFPIVSIQDARSSQAAISHR